MFNETLTVLPGRHVIHLETCSSTDHKVVGMRRTHSCESLLLKLLVSQTHIWLFPFTYQVVDGAPFEAVLFED